MNSEFFPFFKKQKRNQHGKQLTKDEEMVVVSILICYVFVTNLFGFFLMGLDKYKSRKKLWRIPEATLFLVALIGGSIGSFLGMYFFHHKTRHWYFVYGMPLILICQIILIIFLIFYSPIQFYIM